MLNELYTFAEPVQVVPFSSLKWGKFTLLHTISSEAILDNSKKCIFPTFTKVETDDSLSFVYPIIEAFSLISSNE